MSKNTSPSKLSESARPPNPIDESLEVALTPFWLLNAGTAKKLGQHSSGILNYHVLADNDRLGILIAVTRNEGGGYFSRERVPFRTIVACLERYKSGVPSFVSKVLKDVFISKSANNAGFLCAVLHALGLLAAAPESKTQHVVIGNWSLWEKTMLAETGTRIESSAEVGEKPLESDAVLDHKEHKKTLEIPAKNPQ